MSKKVVVSHRLIDRQQQILLKLIIIGDCGVGKTNILIRFCQNQFKPNYIATIGVDFKTKIMNVGDKKLKLQIWDTAGQQRFKTIAQTYYKGVAAIILTYSVIQQKTFENIQKWMQQISQHAPQDVQMILVANKIDLNQIRKVQTIQGKTLADKHNIPFMEVSAKTGQNIKQLFQQLTQRLLKTYVPFMKTKNPHHYINDILDANSYQNKRKYCEC